MLKRTTGQTKNSSTSAYDASMLQKYRLSLYSIKCPRYTEKLKKKNQNYIHLT